VDGLAELDQGRAAYTARAWSEAYRSLAGADRSMVLGPGDLELLARSAYMLGQDDDYADGLERAHRGHLDGGDAEHAIRCAFWIGHHWLFRGEPVRASGWFGRAQRLLDERAGECVERGYLLIPVWLQQMGDGDYQAACTLTAAAAEIGERFGDPDLTWLARDEQGRALVQQGRVTDGLRLVDEVLVVASAGELSPIVTGIVYCNTIAFCQDAYQLQHAREWTHALTRWCESQPEMVAHNGLCLVHRAEVMQLRGEWSEALGEARRAAGRFTAGVLNQLACGKAHYRQGEIHRLRGEVGEADQAYREASRCGYDPQPGLALLRLSQGNSNAAAAAIRRAVAERTQPLERAALLPAYVEIVLAVGELDRATAACRELDDIADRHGSDLLRAMSAQAAGTVALAAGDPDAALAVLRLAWRQWHQLDAPYEAAAVRVLMGSACRSLGDEDTAALELGAARAVFVELEAAPDVARVDALLADSTADAADTCGLTARELEVLRLAAVGKSNRQIAVVLVISEHTVARHLRNIYVKLGVPSRTAASAFAFEHRLV